MARDTSRAEDLLISRTAIEVTARVGLTFLLAYWCFTIAQPFLVALVWGLGQVLNVLPPRSDPG